MHKKTRKLLISDCIPCGFSWTLADIQFPHVDPMPNVETSLVTILVPLLRCQSKTLSTWSGLVFLYGRLFPFLQKLYRKANSRYEAFTVTHTKGSYREYSRQLYQLRIPGTCTISILP